MTACAHDHDYSALEPPWDGVCEAESDLVSAVIDYGECVDSKQDDSEAFEALNDARDDFAFAWLRAKAAEIEQGATGYLPEFLETCEGRALLASLKTVTAHLESVKNEEDEIKRGDRSPDGWAKAAIDRLDHLVKEEHWRITVRYEGDAYEVTGERISMSGQRQLGQRGFVLEAAILGDVGDLIA